MYSLTLNSLTLPTVITIHLQSSYKLFFCSSRIWMLSFSTATFSKS